MQQETRRGGHRQDFLQFEEQRPLQDQSVTCLDTLISGRINEKHRDDYDVGVLCTGILSGFGSESLD
ncbi:MAG: hypothetical protein D3906_18030, partial [Candidatus Electrothrix sp. AUS1_2]|nr:hypothetical protein [Candidatus Electrothrix sp. AUS1_2]